MKKWSQFEWTVLALAAAVLLVMGGWFVFERVEPADTWRVETQRSDSPKPEASASTDGRPDSLREGEAIDLNTASQAELERLPGIGASRARSIVSYRQEHGPFASEEELMRVDGIGSGIFERVRPYIKVG